MNWGIILFICFSVGVCAYASQDVQVFDLMPYPADIEVQRGKFLLDDSFRISVTGNPHERGYRAATRMLRQLSARTGLFFTQDFIRPGQLEHAAAMQVHVVLPGKVALHQDESYTLTIRPKSVTLTADTDIGALRGFETLLQLLKVNSSGYYFPCVTIQDKPRFPWRGLLIDVCRHFMPSEVIKRNLDGMAAVKMNVLHLHLSEDQGFRIECKTYPKLHEMGSDGLYYTHAQIKEIIAYADDRGIRVVPEFDIPGHTTSWFAGYPDLASAPGPYEISRGWGIHEAVMDPTREQTYAFLDGFFNEMCALFPDEYMHIGGDEANYIHWKKNRTIRRFMEANDIRDFHELQAYFNRRVNQILSYYGKKMMGWDEILHPELPKSILIQSWRGKEAMIQCAKDSVYTILSNGYYIDLIHPADIHYLNDPSPADVKLTEEQRKFILGGETTMWAEFVTPETIDSRIWPRTAAIAERFWSPESVKDVHDMYSRLEAITLQLEELGLTHEKNRGMMLRRLICSREIHPLEVLVDVLEPVKGYQRGALREYTSYSPMTRMVDIARPDASVARKFRWNVKAFLEVNLEPGTAQMIEEQMSVWKENHSELTALIRQIPALDEIKPHAEHLFICAQIGLEALNKIRKGDPVKKKWKKNHLKTLKKMHDPHGQTELMIVSAIKQLVDGVPER
ncbi:family 20 glycosylhydrolase [bacterium]|nr:family 20 glycosylhydrolase [bacterium]